MRIGGLAGQDEDAGADDGANAEQRQVDGAEHASSRGGSSASLEAGAAPAEMGLVANRDMGLK